MVRLYNVDICVPALWQALPQPGGGPALGTAPGSPLPPAPSHHTFVQLSCHPHVVVLPHALPAAALAPLVQTGLLRDIRTQSAFGHEQVRAGVCPLPGST